MVSDSVYNYNIIMYDVLMRLNVFKSYDVLEGRDNLVFTLLYPTYFDFT